MLARAERKAQGDSRVELRLGDVRELSTVEGQFDFVISTWTLSHLEQPEATVRGAITRGSGQAPAGLLHRRWSSRGVSRALLSAGGLVADCHSL